VFSPVINYSQEKSITMIMIKTTVVVVVMMMMMMIRRRRKTPSNTPEKQGINELQKTAILGTADILRKVLM
jgi:uncharacterized protein YpmB